MTLQVAKQVAVADRSSNICAEKGTLENLSSQRMCRHGECAHELRGTEATFRPLGWHSAPTIGHHPPWPPPSSTSPCSGSAVDWVGRTDVGAVSVPKASLGHCLVALFHQSQLHQHQRPHCLCGRECPQQRRWLTAPGGCLRSVKCHTGARAKVESMYRDFTHGFHRELPGSRALDCGTRPSPHRSREP